MNTFDLKLRNNVPQFYPLRADKITTLQVNMGYKCNLRCIHCHVDASPDRTEEMPLHTVYKLLNILEENSEITIVDITGGSPELNPNFKYFVKAVSDMDKNVMVRTNLTIYSEDGMKDIPEFLKENRVKIIASLPCYTEEGVDKVRGKGTYKKVISALRHLNKLGYGKEGTGLEIDIMFNPADASIAPDQHMLENVYKEKLKEMHGITFNHLITLRSMPIGRLRKSMTDSQRKEYLKLLEEKFNPDTVNNLMCRRLISVSPHGKLYDCDFWQMLNLPVKNGNPHINDFSYQTLRKREIVTNSLCFMCTAGAGASCTGALV